MTLTASSKEMVAALESTGDFRVLRRFVPRDCYADLSGRAVSTVSVVDFETTGVEEEDKPIEIGIVQVEYDLETCRIGRVVDRYSGLEDPGIPIPPHITALTGITDDMVKGKRFDDDRVNSIVSRTGITVAHNAEFDRGFGERRFPSMAERPWGCSMADIDWKEAGVPSQKLDYIVMTRGWFHAAHRAVDDSEITAAVLGRPVLDGKTALWHLIQRARRPHFRIWALDAPYKLKGVLSRAGYRWCDGERYEWRAWRISTPDLEGELRFLEEEVYGRGGQVLVETVGTRNRFTERREGYEMVTLGQRALA